MLRGNMEFGFVSALVPLALACPIVLLRRFGLTALPFCGALAGLLSTDLVVEYAIFVGIPACFAAIANAYDRTRRLRWFGFSVACFVVFLAVAAYTAIPTVASHALFSPGAPTDALLQGGEFSSYAEGPLALASLMLNESLANQRPEFLLGPLIWIALPAGLILWALAIGWVVRGIRRRSFASGERVLLIVGLICLLVSMGDVIPGRRPRLVGDRTSYRASIIFERRIVSSLSAFRWSSSAPFHRSNILRAARQRANLPIRRARASLRPRISRCSFCCRVFLGDTFALEERLPHLDRIDAVAEARGNRAMNIALVDTGSVFDTSLYAMMMPNLDFAATSRSATKATGLAAPVCSLVRTLRRSSHRRPGRAIPRCSTQSAIAARVLPALARRRRDHGRGVRRRARSRLRPSGRDPHVSTAAPACSTTSRFLPAFAYSAFVPNGRDCARTLYTDSAPASALVGGRIVASFPGTAVFANAGVLRDIDYRVALGRFFLNIPWYRNAIDGDSPQLSDGAVSLDTGKDAAEASFALARGGDYAIALRAVCHGTIHGNAANRWRDGRYRSPARRRRGFRGPRSRPAGAVRARIDFAVTVGEFDTNAAGRANDVAFRRRRCGRRRARRARRTIKPPVIRIRIFGRAFRDVAPAAGRPAMLTLVSTPGFEVDSGQRRMPRARCFWRVRPRPSRTTASPEPPGDIAFLRRPMPMEASLLGGTLSRDIERRALLRRPFVVQPRSRPAALRRRHARAAARRSRRRRPAHRRPTIRSAVVATPQRRHRAGSEAGATRTKDVRTTLRVSISSSDRRNTTRSFRPDRRPFPATRR